MTRAPSAAGGRAGNPPDVQSTKRVAPEAEYMHFDMGAHVLTSNTSRFMTVGGEDAEDAEDA